MSRRVILSTLSLVVLATTTTAVVTTTASAGGYGNSGSYGNHGGYQQKYNDQDWRSQGLVDQFGNVPEQDLENGFINMPDEDIPDDFDPAAARNFEPIAGSSPDDIFRDDLGNMPEQSPEFEVFGVPDVNVPDNTGFEVAPVLPSAPDFQFAPEEASATEPLPLATDQTPAEIQGNIGENPAEALPVIQNEIEATIE